MRSSSVLRLMHLLTALSIVGSAGEAYRVALPGYRYEFPRDHFNHPDFQTEWWYYTGNLSTAAGRRFGFELTFFRQGVSRDPSASRAWDVRDVWLAHLALSDLDRGRFYHLQRLNRAGPGLAGADTEQKSVWNGNWRTEWTGSDLQKLRAYSQNFSLDLSLRSTKPPVMHGKNGVSQKSAAPGHGSHYISLTRLGTNGDLMINGTHFEVAGSSWMDHEFFTQQLSADQAGWDWFSLQLEDGSELMLFRLRRKDGSSDAYSAGTYVDAGGRSRCLGEKDFSVTPGETWTSPATHAVYPIDWRVQVLPLKLQAHLSTRLRQQELSGQSKVSPAYWEGAIEVRGSREGRSLTGVGYLEMTGYAGGQVPMPDK